MSKHGDSPMKATLVSMTGAAADEHDTDPPGANPLSLQAGHEPDSFGVRAILYVPALVVVTLISAYVLITVIFSFIVRTGGIAAPRPDQNEQVAVEVARPINDRFATISSTAPVPVPGKPDTAFAQPRLEYSRLQGDTEDPPYLRSKRPLQGDTNPPEIRPEYLRAENYVDPASGQKILLATELVPNKDEKTARIPIADAIRLAVAKDGKGKLPVAKDAIVLPSDSGFAPKFSNGGTAPVTAAPAAHADKHDDKKAGH